MGPQHTHPKPLDSVINPLNKHALIREVRDELHYVLHALSAFASFSTSDSLVRLYLNEKTNKQLNKIKDNGLHS